jgi:hypothetical protein
VDQGNLLGLTSSWTDVSGQVHGMADVWFNTKSLTDLINQATAEQKVDLTQDPSGNTVDVHLTQVLQAAHKMWVVKADANDVVRVDQSGWLDTGTSTVVDGHVYDLWSNAAAHLLIDRHATVHTVL